MTQKKNLGDKTSQQNPRVGTWEKPQLKTSMVSATGKIRQTKIRIGRLTK